MQGAETICSFQNIRGKCLLEDSLKVTFGIVKLRVPVQRDVSTCPDVLLPLPDVDIHLLQPEEFTAQDGIWNIQNTCSETCIGMARVVLHYLQCPQDTEISLMHSYLQIFQPFR